MAKSQIFGDLAFIECMGAILDIHINILGKNWKQVVLNSMTYKEANKHIFPISI